MVSIVQAHVGSADPLHGTALALDWTVQQCHHECDRLSLGFSQTHLPPSLKFVTDPH